MLQNIMTTTPKVVAMALNLEKTSKQLPGLRAIVPSHSICTSTARSRSRIKMSLRRFDSKSKSLQTFEVKKSRDTVPLTFCCTLRKFTIFKFEFCLRKLSRACGKSGKYYMQQINNVVTYIGHICILYCAYLGTVYGKVIEC